MSKTRFTILIVMFLNVGALYAQVENVGGESLTVPPLILTPLPYKYSGVVPIEGSALSHDGQKLPDQVLRIVHATDRQKDVALLVVGALLGSFRTPISKENYKGEKVSTLQHPQYPDLFSGMGPLIDDWVKKNAEGRNFKNPLLIRPDRYQLIYRGTDEKPDYYDLKIESSISRLLDSGNRFFSLHKTFTCTYIDDQSKTTLEDWQRNDYEKVRQVHAKFVADCLKLAEKELPALLAP